MVCPLKQNMLTATVHEQKHSVKLFALTKNQPHAAVLRAPTSNN